MSHPNEANASIEVWILRDNHLRGLGKQAERKESEKSEFKRKSILSAGDKNICCVDCPTIGALARFQSSLYRRGRAEKREWHQNRTCNDLRSPLRTLPHFNCSHCNTFRHSHAYSYTSDCHSLGNSHSLQNSNLYSNLYLTGKRIEFHLNTNPIACFNQYTRVRGHRPATPN